MCVKLGIDMKLGFALYTWALEVNVEAEEIESLIERASKINSVLTLIKPLYGELDEIVWQLATVPNIEVYGVMIKDNYNGRNVAWKATGVRRFELIFR